MVTALPAAARLARPRELARILLAPLPRPSGANGRASAARFPRAVAGRHAVSSARRVRKQRWLIMALLVGMVSALEFLLDSRSSSEESLTRQNRYFGGVYAAIAIATCFCCSPDDPPPLDCRRILRRPRCA